MYDSPDGCADSAAASSLNWSTEPAPPHWETPSDWDAAPASTPASFETKKAEPDWETEPEDCVWDVPVSPVVGMAEFWNSPAAKTDVWAPTVWTKYYAAEADAIPP